MSVSAQELFSVVLIVIIKRSLVVDFDRITVSGYFILLNRAMVIAMAHLKLPRSSLLLFLLLVL